MPVFGGEETGVVLSHDLLYFNLVWDSVCVALGIRSVVLYAEGRISPPQERASNLCSRLLNRCVCGLDLV